MVVAVISADACHFLAFLDLTCHHEDIEIGAFFGCTVLPDGKETELGSSNQEASPSAGKKFCSVLLRMCAFCACKCVPTAISGGVDIS